MVKKVLPLGFPITAAFIILMVISPLGLTPEKIAGICVSGGLWLIGYALTRWGEGQSSNILLGIVIGGMLFRIAVAILSIVFVSKFTEMNLIRYVISLMIFYLACEFGLVLDYTLRKTDEQT